MRILIVEDSRRLRESLCEALHRFGYALDSAADGEEACRMARRHQYDVILLDLMLPKMNGLTVLQNLRNEDNSARVLILTAKDSVPDRVSGLNEGADDYLTKPFSFDELVARIQALVRRKYEMNTPKIVVDGLTIDTAERRATRDQKEIVLTAREYALLEYLAMRKGRVVSRQQIEEAIYDGRQEVLASNAVDSAICVLRKKIDKPDGLSLIQTRRGLGYMLTEDDQAS